MTDVQEPSPSSEPSMEEILASIRRIIADEKDPVTAAAIIPEDDSAKEDVLELTQMVQDDGSVVDLGDVPPAAAPSPSPSADTIDFDPVPVAASTMAEEPLMSHDAAEAATSSLAALASTVQVERRVAFEGHTLIGEGGRTLEDIVMALMRPMLKEWLDQNLPVVVERIVQKEVEHIARRATE